MQVIITLTAFSVFTLSLNLSSRAACCANQLHRAPVTSICSALLASTQGLTGACRRAAAPALSAKTAIFHRAVSGVTGSLSLAPHTSFSLCLLPASGWTNHKTRGEKTWHLCHSATPKRYGWYCDILCDWMHVVSHDPSKRFVEMVLMPWWQCSSLAQWHVRLANGKLITARLGWVS